MDIEDVALPSREPEAFVERLKGVKSAIVNLRTFVPEDVLFALYHIADAVLANSGKEPFGLVGLEVMAASGVAVTGSTGEDYAQPFENAVVCDTGDSGDSPRISTRLLSIPRSRASSAPRAPRPPSVLRGRSCLKSSPGNFCDLSIRAPLTLSS